MKCPYCAETIQDEAQKCRFCGEWIVKQAATSQARAVTKGIKDKELHDQIRNIVWLPIGIISYGAYLVTGNWDTFWILALVLLGLFVVWYYRE